jgi:hypothetical protein
MKKLIFAAVMVLGLVACGGGGGSGPATSSAPLAVDALAAKPLPPPDPTLVGQGISLVNTTTAGNQLFRSIGALTDGGYTVAWVSENATLFIQRYDAAGNKVGGEIAVPLFVAGTCGPTCDASTTAAAITEGGLAVLSDGSVVVAYSATRAVPSSLSSKRAVYIQRFDATGAQVLPETEVVSSVEVLHSRSDSYLQVKVEALADGGFVVGWANVSPSSVGIFGHAIFTRRYDSAAQPVGDPVLVKSFTAFPGGELYRLAADAQGGYTVYVFERTIEPPFATQNWTFHFDANGTVAQIGVPTFFDALLLPLEGDRFLLFTGSTSGPVRQFLDGSGVPVGDPIPIPSVPLDAQELADGSFVVFWNLSGNLIAQRFDSSGAPMGNLLTISTHVGLMGVAALADTGFAVGWSGPSGAGDLDVFTESFIEVLSPTQAELRAKRKACLASAKGITGQERKAFMDACMQ